MSALSNVLRSLLAESIETLAEDQIRDAVDEGQQKFEELIAEEAEKLLVKLQSTDKLPDEAKVVIALIGDQLKSALTSAIYDAANGIVEWVWEKTQTINKKDATSPAPKFAEIEEQFGGLDDQ